MSPPIRTRRSAGKREGSGMWVPTQSTAIETSARHDETRHRADAAERARRTAATLAEKGDHQGHAVWSQVADSVERLRQPHLVDSRRAREMT